MELHEAADQGEAEPQPPAGPVERSGHLVEELEDGVEVLGLDPTPVSATESIARPSSGSTAARTRPPRGVYLRAFVSRLFVICSRRTASPSTISGSCGSA